MERGIARGSEFISYQSNNASTIYKISMIFRVGFRKQLFASLLKG